MRLALVACVGVLSGCDQLFGFDTVSAPHDGSDDASNAGSDAGSGDGLMTCFSDMFGAGPIDAHLTVSTTGSGIVQSSSQGLTITWGKGAGNAGSVETGEVFDLRGSEVDADVEGFSGDLADSDLYVVQSTQHYLDVAVDANNIDFELAAGGSGYVVPGGGGYSSAPVHVRLSFDANGDNVTFYARTGTGGEYSHMMAAPFGATGLSIGLAAGTYGDATQSGEAVLNNLVVRQPVCF